MWEIVSNFVAYLDKLNFKKDKKKLTNDSNKGQILFVFDEFGGFFEVHFVGVHGVVAGGQGQTAQSARACAVLDGGGHDLATDCWGHGLFITSNSVNKWRINIL